VPASSPPPLAEWLAAHAESHQRLTAIVEQLRPEEIAGPSYDTEWSIAQVLSHLGSGAQIFGLFLESGLAGSPAPGMVEFQPIWDTWNAKSPADQAADYLSTEQAFVERLAALSDDERQNWRLDMFGSEQDLSGFLRFRVGEHALHTWDVEVIGDPDATVAQSAADLMVDHVGQLASMTGKVPEQDLDVTIATVAPSRRFTIAAVDGTVEVRTEDGEEGPQATLELPAESFIRLVYGRLDPEHTPASVGQGDVVDVLRSTFPGF